jgi:hypothetical protein
MGLIDEGRNEIDWARLDIFRTNYRAILRPSTLCIRSWQNTALPQSFEN